MPTRLSMSLLLACVLPAQAAGPPPRPLLDREGEALPPGAVARFGAARLRLSYPRFCAFAPDGKTLAVSTDGGIREWSLVTGRVLTALHQKSLHGTRLTYAPDGSQVLFGDNGVRILGMGGGGARAHLEPARSGDRAEEVVFSADGRRAAVVWWRQGVKEDQARTLTLYELDRDRQAHRLTTAAHISAVCFSRDGALLACGVGKEVGLWNGRSGALQRMVPSRPGAEYPVSALALSDDGKYLAVGQDYQAHLLRIDASAEVNVFAPIKRWVAALRFSPDGKELWGFEGIRVFRWSATTGKELGTITVGGVNTTGAFGVSPDRRRLVVADPRGPVHVWDLQTNREAVRLEQPLTALEQVVFTGPDTVGTVRQGGSVLFWSARDGRLLHEYPAPVRLTGYAYPKLSPTGRHLAVPRESGQELSLHDLTTGRQLWSLSVGKGQEIGSFAFSPDGLTLLLHQEEQIVLCEVTSGRQFRVLKVGQYGAVAFSPDGRTLAFCDYSPLLLLELASGKVRRKLKAPPRPERGHGADSIRFAAGGRFVGVSRPNDVFVYDLRSGDLIFHQNYPDRGDTADLLALSPDGRWLALTTYGPVTLRDLHAPAGSRPLLLDGHIGSVRDMTFSPDGTRLVTVSGDGSALVWDLQQLRNLGDTQGPAPTEPLGLWARLAAEDAEAADQAMRELERTPAAAVALLGTRLRPTPPGPSRARLDALVADLGAASFEVRERAAGELAGLAELAAPALRAALERKPALEQQRRIERLMARLDGPEVDPERLRALRAVEVLERIGSPAARAVLERLAGGAEPSNLTREAKASLSRLNGPGKGASR